MPRIPRPAFLSREHLSRDLRSAAVALVVSVLVLGAPSVAAKITNADTVDGKHAVGAGASVKKRAGKLVATNKQGRLPNNIVAKAPDADRLDGLDSTAVVPRMAPRGQVQTGGFSAWGGGAGSYISDAVNFASSLPAAIPSSRVTVVPDGGPFTAECPGYHQVVPSGWACLYMVNQGSASLGSIYDGTSSPTLEGVGRTGFHIYYTCTDASCYAYGGWAVRAGSTQDVAMRHKPSRRSIP